MAAGAIKFITEEYTVDESGFKTKKIIYSEEMPCIIQDSTRQDQTLANQCGYTADMVIKMLTGIYGKQKSLLCVNDGEVYDIKRKFVGKNGTEIQLTCQRREIL